MCANIIGRAALPASSVVGKAALRRVDATGLDERVAGGTVIYLREHQLLLYYYTTTRDSRYSPAPLRRAKGISAKMYIRVLFIYMHIHDAPTCTYSEKYNRMYSPSRLCVCTKVHTKYNEGELAKRHTHNTHVYMVMTGMRSVAAGWLAGCECGLQTHIIMHMHKYIQ